jgi:superfamily II DNA/RNA helicase
MLMSATTSDDVDRLRELMLHSAVDVAVTGAAGDTRANTAAGSAAEIEHYRIDCPRWPRNRQRALYTSRKCVLHTLRDAESEPYPGMAWKASNLCSAADRI